MSKDGHPYRGRIRPAFILAVFVFAVFALVSPPRIASSQDPEAVLAALVEAGIVDAGVAAEVTANGTVKALVQYHDSGVIDAAEGEKRRRGLKEDTRDIIDTKASGFRAIKAGVRARGGKDVAVIRDYDHFAIQYVKFDSISALVEAASDPAVRSVTPNASYALQLAQSLPLIQQPQAALAGRTGSGVSVAVLDSGLDYLAPHFGCTAVNTPATTCKVPFVQDFAPDDGVRDDDGHGTNVSGIVSAVAPGAKVLGLDVFTGSSASDVNIIAALDFVIANQATYNIRAVNMSLGSSTHSTTACTNSYTTVFANLRAAGILPVVAAGNAASSSGSFTNGIATPACVAGALSVGAVYDSTLPSTPVWAGCPGATAEVSTAADQIVCFSQSGPNLGVLAPGAMANAAGTVKSGTSMAAPHVAGAAAVLAAAAPSQTVDQRETSLVSTGASILDTRNSVTKNRLNLCAALAHAGSNCTAAGPSNDDRANATVISASPALVRQSTVGFTTEVGDPSLQCSLIPGQQSASAWFKLTTESAGTLSVNTNDSNYPGVLGGQDTVLAVHRLNGSSLEMVGCDDESGNGSLSALTVGLLASNTYYIEVTAFDTGPGGYLVMNVSYTGTLAGATLSTSLAWNSFMADGVAGMPLPVQPSIEVRTGGGVRNTTDNSTQITLSLDNADPLQGSAPQDGGGYTGPPAAELKAAAGENGRVNLIIGSRTPGRPSFEGDSFAGLSAVAAGQSRIDSALQATPSAEVGARFQYMAAAAVTIDANAIDTLLANPDITHVQVNHINEPHLDLSGPLIGLPAAHAAGYSGDGQTVAVLDTGVQTNHPFLAGKTVAEACFSGPLTGTQVSLCPNGQPSQTGAGAGVNCSIAITGCNHGTHVAGIVLGENGSMTGVAHDASLISILMYYRENNATACGGTAPCVRFSDAGLILALEHVYSLRGDYDIAAVNLSGGGGQYFTQAACDLDWALVKVAVDALVGANIAFVASSGNNGFTSSLGGPACLSSAISVGSTTSHVPADVVASSSNAASFLTLLAPGVAINSSVPNDTYSSFNGTSMAAPQVAGAIALLREKSNNVSVAEARNALHSTGVIVTDSRSGANNLQKPRIQVDAALQALDGGVLTCTGGLTQTVVAGVANFTGCKVSTPGENYRIVASAAAMTPQLSSPFDIVPPPTGPTVQLHWVQGPQNVPATAAMDDITVEGQTAGNVRNTSDSATQVTLALSPGNTLLGEGDPSPQITLTAGSPTTVQVHLLRQAIPGAAARAAYADGRLSSVISTSGGLTPPSDDPPEVVANRFIGNISQAAGFGPTAQSTFNIQKVDTSPGTGLTVVGYRQTVEGLAVFDAYAKVGIAQDGRVISFSTTLSSETALAATTANVTPDQAIMATEAAVGPRATVIVTDGVTAALAEDLAPKVEEVAYRDGTTLRRGYMVLLPQDDDYWMTVVDQESGALAYQASLQANDAPEGSVFTEHPDAGPRTTEPFEGNIPGHPEHNDWFGGNSTFNCALAHVHCTLGNNTTTILAREGFAGDFFWFVSVSGIFNFPWTDGWRQTGLVGIDVDIPATVTNLFYFTNVVHDWLYMLGFTEGAANFQDNNYGNGGLGGDEVWSLSQYGFTSCDIPQSTCRNNANFSTPPEGFNGIMRMYLFDTPNQRDGSVDGDVVVHEYGHGLSTRLVDPLFVNSLFGIQSGALGEGWSDYLAATYFDDDVIGEYVTGNTTRGIRYYRYEGHPWTYGHVCETDYGLGPTCSVHQDGEIWAAALWKMRSNIIDGGGTANTADLLVVDGLKLTNENPTMLDARDAILLADLATNSGAYECTLWEAFADSGMGVSASSNGHNDMDPIESFDVPLTCGGPPPLPVLSCDQPLTQSLIFGAATWTNCTIDAVPAATPLLPFFVTASASGLGSVPSPGFNTTNPAYDATCDGTFDAIDALAVLRSIAGFGGGILPVAPCTGSANGGALLVSDVLQLRMKLAELD